MKKIAIIAVACAASLMPPAGAAENPRPECWCWLISRLNNEADYSKATNLIDRASASGYTAMVIQGFEDIRYNPVRARRLENLAAFAKSRSLEIIPGIWSAGSGGAIAWADSDCMETTPAKDVPYTVSGGKAVFAANRVPTEYDGRTVTTNVMFSLAGRVRPYRTYRLTCEVKTENLAPVKYSTLRGMLFHGSGYEVCQELMDFIVKPSQDWTPYTWEFNTYENADERFEITLNTARTKTGCVWFRSIRIEERPLTCVLTTEPSLRPTVRSAATGKTYVEGKDYAPFPKMRGISNRQPIVPDILPGSAISEGEKLLVSAYVPAVVNGRQYSICPSAPRLKDFWRKTAGAIDGILRPRRWFLTVDEWRVANRCPRCKARNVSPGQLMGECIAAMAETIREVHQGAEVCAWADMLCPLENAGRFPYYCINGKMHDSWKYVPKDLIMVPWMNGHDEIKTTKWLMARGFRCVAGGFYNRKDLSQDVRWRESCIGNPLFLGMMFTSWGGNWADGSYRMLEDFGKMVHEGKWK